MIRTIATAAAIAGALTVLTACSAPDGGPSGGKAVLAGNRSLAASQAGSPGVPAPADVNPDSGACLFGANGADVQVGIGDPTDSCAHWIAALAGSGLAWYSVTQMILPGSAGAADGETMQEACDLTDGTQELYVVDAGGQINGDGICSSEERNGWTPEGSPGPLAAQAQRQAEQQAQVQASEAAGAAQQQAQAQQAQQVSQAQQSLSSDVSTLESDFNALNTNTQLASDISQMKTDYGTEHADYRTEQTHGSCSDGSMGADASQVSADSSSVDADLSSLQADVQSLQDNGIAGIQADVSAVNGDLSTLRGLGASPATDASGALAAGAKAISNANAAITWANGQGNTIDGNAQQLSTTASNYESQHGC